MGKVCYSYFDFPRFRESRRSDFDEEERCKVGKPYCIAFTLALLTWLARPTVQKISYFDAHPRLMKSIPEHTPHTGAREGAEKNSPITYLLVT